MRRTEQQIVVFGSSLSALLAMGGEASLATHLMSFLNVAERAQFARVSRRARELVASSESLPLHTAAEIEAIQADVRAQFPGLFIRPFIGPITGPNGRPPCSRDIVVHTLNRLCLPTQEQVESIITGSNNDQSLIQGDRMNAANVERYRCSREISDISGIVLLNVGLGLFIWPIAFAKSPSAATLVSMTAAGIALMIMGCCLTRISRGIRPAVQPSYVHTLMARCALWIQRRDMERMPLLLDGEAAAPAAAL